jgi:hypothetical protein
MTLYTLIRPPIRRLTTRFVPVLHCTLDSRTTQTT